MKVRLTSALTHKTHIHSHIHTSHSHTSTLIVDIRPRPRVPGVDPGEHERREDEPDGSGTGRGTNSEKARRQHFRALFVDMVSHFDCDATVVCGCSSGSCWRKRPRSAPTLLPVLKVGYLHDFIDNGLCTKCEGTEDFVSQLLDF